MFWCAGLVYTKGFLRARSSNIDRITGRLCITCLLRLNKIIKWTLTRGWFQNGASGCTFSGALGYGKSAEEWHKSVLGWDSILNKTRIWFGTSKLILTRNFFNEISWGVPFNRLSLVRQEDGQLDLYALGPVAGQQSLLGGRIVPTESRQLSWSMRPRAVRVILRVSDRTWDDRFCMWVHF